MPLLTIPLVVRNDNYLPGYTDRAKMSIRSFLNAFDGVDVEFFLIDYNQVSGRPFSSVFSHPKLKHIVVTESEIRNKIQYHMDNGVILVRLDGSCYTTDDFLKILTFQGCWALNEGLRLATGDYFVYTTTDVIACKHQLHELLNILRPKTMFKCQQKAATQQYVSNNFDAITALDNVGEVNLRFDRKNLKKCKVGNGQFSIIDTKSAREFGGMLPYLIHRGKGADFFASFISSAIGHESCIPDYSVVAMDHAKSQLMVPRWNYVIKNGDQINFDYFNDYEYIRNWVKTNYINPDEFHNFDKPHFFTLNADRDMAMRFLNAFKPYLSIS